MAGWSVDADTLRRRRHEQAACVAASRADRDELPAAFAGVAGDHALHIDAGKVNTVEGGWRDVKVAAVARRRRGEPCDGAGRDERRLPTPSARSVVAAVEGREAFGPRLEAEALRLSVPLGIGQSVRGDGAEWIGNLAEDPFHGATQVLDVWHAVEKLASAGVWGWGPESPSRRGWARRKGSWWPTAMPGRARRWGR